MSRVLQTQVRMQVHSGAEAEFRLEQLMRKIKRQWETRQFQLAKHIHVVQKPVAMDVDSSGGFCFHCVFLHRMTKARL